VNVKEIVHQYLENNGYDGLCGDDCGCPKDDLCPCDSCMDECRPAHVKKCLGKNCPNPCDAFDEEGKTDCYSDTSPTTSERHSVIDLPKMKLLLTSGRSVISLIESCTTVEQGEPIRLLIKEFDIAIAELEEGNSNPCKTDCEFYEGCLEEFMHKKK